MQVKRMKLSELHKTERNIRRHSDRQIKEYVRSIEMFGQTKPIVAADDGEILVGNGLYDALIAMGREEADVYVIPNLSKAKRKKLMLADNKVYELGFTDISALDDILLDIGNDFDIPGFDENLLRTIVSTPPEVDERIAEYGLATPEVSQTHVQDAPVYQHEAESTPVYAPPVRTEAGAFVAPEQTEERRYVICPHCGEKVWL